MKTSQESAFQNFQVSEQEGLKIKYGKTSTFFNEEKVASGKPATYEYRRRKPKNGRHIGNIFWLVDDIQKILVILAWSQELMVKSKLIKCKSGWEGEEDNDTVHWNSAWM